MSILKLFSKAAREQQHDENFIRFTRQLATLLAAGRALTTVWQEMLGLYPKCASTVSPDDPDPRCCLHHVIATQVHHHFTAEELFAQITGPGQTRYWKQLAGAIQLAQTTGVGLATVLERLADALDAGQDAEQARESAAAGPKSTAQLLSWLPLAGIGLSAMMGVTILDLLSSVFGWVVLVTGVGLSVAGRLWTNRMIRQADAV